MGTIIYRKRRTITDLEWMESLKEVVDSVEMLKIFIDNEHLFGCDPYYGDLSRALFNNAERVVKEYIWRGHD